MRLAADERERRKADREGRNSDQSNWHEYAIFLAADALAITYLREKSSFRAGDPTYTAFRGKKAVESLAADAVRNYLRQEAEHRGGNAIADLDRITPDAIKQLFKPSRRRSELDRVVGERLATMSAAADGNAIDPALEDLAAEFAKFLIQ